MKYFLIFAFLFSLAAPATLAQVADGYRTDCFSAFALANLEKRKEELRPWLDQLEEKLRSNPSKLEAVKDTLAQNDTMMCDFYINLEGKLECLEVLHSNSSKLVRTVRSLINSALPYVPPNYIPYFYGVRVTVDSQGQVSAILRRTTRQPAPQIPPDLLRD